MITGLKARLARHETLFGCFVMLPSPAIVEMVGYAGFDYVILDAEHGPAGTETIEHQLRAADASNIPAIVRISSRAQGDILRVLDSGASGVLIPHVTTADEARSIIAAAHFPPEGSRGMATTSRAGRHGMVAPLDYIQQARAETIVLCQIEDAVALPRVREIASTPGLDGLFVGPADLATSMGHPGELGHAEVVAAIDGVVRDARGLNGPALATFARTEAEAKHQINQGFCMICASTTSLLSRRLSDMVAELRR